MQYSEVIDPNHNHTHCDVQGGKKGKAPKTCCISFPRQIYTLVQNCQLEFSCVEQLSSTVKEFTVVLFRTAFE